MEENSNSHREDGKRTPRPRKAIDKGKRVLYSSSSDRKEDKPHRDFNHPQKKAYRPRNEEGTVNYKEGEQSERPRKGRSQNADYKKKGKPSADGKRPFKNGKSANHSENYKVRKPKQIVPKAPKVIPPTARPNPANEGTTRLNKYIANAGICSRREADKLIAAGAVTVNGNVITEMGYKVLPGDVVNYGGETLRSEPKRYVLLNKPKGFITTLDDPQERRTVMELVENACKERIYPVGRLDRDTTGLLLFTNDGELAKKLTHPSTGIYKIYQVELNRPVAREDMNKMLEGIELEDGLIRVDDVQYVNGSEDRRIVGVELHSGRNRIVRRIFEALGYDVHKLDRTVFAGLTKKDLPRGRYRELTTKEIAFLKMI